MPNESPAPHDEDKVCSEPAGEKCEEKIAEKSTLAFQRRDTTESMDPFSIALGVVALTGAITSTASEVGNLRSSYLHALEDSQHIQGQKKHIQLNRFLLEDEKLGLSSLLYDALQSSLIDIETALPAQPCEGSKRDKIRWAAGGGRRKARDEIAKLKETESSATLSLSLTALIKWGETIKVLNTLTNQLSARDQKHEEQLRLLEASMQDQRHNAVLKNSPECSQKKVATIRRWIFCLGISLQFIALPGNSHAVYTLFLHLPLFFNMILISRVRIIQGWPKIYIKLRSRNEIPSNSAIIRACQENDLDCIKKILCESPSHVNDVTSDNLTLLRFAIRAGHLKVVELLLNSGADPNQTFGENETSPLNNAFLMGRADMVRLLLRSKFKADLDYVNAKTWTCIFYLWDPVEPEHSTVSEILDICGEQNFSGWHIAERSGWAPIHRAAVYGKEEHIEKLFNMGAFDRRALPLTPVGWSPMHCAAMFGNLSTLKYLIQVDQGGGTSLGALARLKDKRGWTLLHLAVASGSQEMMKYLLMKGFDPEALSDKSAFIIPGRLHYIRLTPRDVAEHYGHLTKYDDALRAFLDYKKSIEAG